MRVAKQNLVALVVMPVIKGKSVTQYDKKYRIENNLFGQPYPEFVAFVKEYATIGHAALDLGCGQETIKIARR